MGYLEDAVNGLINAVTTINGYITDIYAKLESVFSEGLDKALSTGGALLDFVTNIANEAIETAKDYAQTLVDTVQSGIDLVTTQIDLIWAAISNGVDGLDILVEALDKALNEGMDKVLSRANKLVQEAVDSIETEIERQMAFVDENIKLAVETVTEEFEAQTAKISSDVTSLRAETARGLAGLRHQFEVAIEKAISPERILNVIIKGLEAMW